MQLQLQARSQRDVETAIAQAEQALRDGLDKEDAELAHNLVASCLLQLATGRANEILKILEQRGPSSNWEDSRDIAVNDLQKAITHVPDLAEAYPLIYKLCALPGGDRELGLKACNESIRLSADNRPALAEAYKARATFQEKPEDQLADLQLAAEADPANRETLQLRAALLVQQRKYAEAADVLRELIRDEEGNAKYHLALAEVLANMEGKFDEALQEITRGIELAPDSSEGYLLRARLHTSREELDTALADLNEALQRNKNDVAALLFRAELHLFRDDTKAAREDVERSLQIRPGLVLAVLLRSRISAAEKRYDEAIADMQLLVQNDPQNVDFRLQLAAYHNAAERPRKAIQILSDMIEEDGKAWRALRARGDALLSIGKHTEAIQDYERALAIEANDSGLLNNLAWVLATSPDDSVRDAKRAIELATKACELTQYKEAHILSTLASGYAESGDFAKAIEWSTKAVELGEGEMKEQLQKELESYQRSEPWRERQEVKDKPELSKKNLLET